MTFNPRDARSTDRLRRGRDEHDCWPRHGGVGRARQSRRNVARATPRRIGHAPFHGMMAGDEKGLVASVTNMTKALKLLVPLLDTCIGVLGECPGID